MATNPTRVPSWFNATCLVLRFSMDMSYLFIVWKANLSRVIVSGSLKTYRSILKVICLSSDVHHLQRIQLVISVGCNQTH